MDRDYNGARGVFLKWFVQEPTELRKSEGLGRSPFLETEKTKSSKDDLLVFPLYENQKSSKKILFSDSKESKDKSATSVVSNSLEFDRLC